MSDGVRIWIRVWGFDYFFCSEEGGRRVWSLGIVRNKYLRKKGENRVVEVFIGRC